MELNNDDLYKKHDQLMKLKKETYDKIYNRCKNTIRLASSTGELIYFYEIPQIMFGSSYPMINVKSCANYVMNKLENSNKNIKCSFYEPNIIFIDWRRKQDMIRYYENMESFKNK